jgi:hypothetical protein
MGGATATLVLADFRTAYAAFATAPPDATVQAYFALAGEVWLRNDGTGRVKDVGLQTQLMYMLTAHLCQLFSGPDGNDPNGLVGRASSATQGSVTLALEYASTNNSQWFDQTPYGAAFWQATAAYRSFPKYVRSRSRFGNGIGTGFGSFRRF